MTARILIVDDDESMCGMLAAAIAHLGHETKIVNTVAQALETLVEVEIDVIVTDMRMQKRSGLDLCHHVVESRPDIPVIIMTAFGTLESAIEAIRVGAYDFLTKPFELDHFRMSVQRAWQHRCLSQRIVRLESALREATVMDGMIGASSPMEQMFDLIGMVAGSDSTVLISGESGTGKELVAQALHRQSSRRNAPFIAINCAAVPEPLLESEMFGHVKGAFTDARSDRMGLFLQAHGGTLFLDEIGEIPASLQSKLLRALQERVVRPVGGRNEANFDARIIAATNRDLEAAVEAGEFRNDLYYRIQVIQVDVPPLRVRGNDILLLAKHFVERYSLSSRRNVTGILPAAAERLLAYSWPGNVRELQNCVERAVILCRHSQLGVDDLPEKIRNFARQFAAANEDATHYAKLEEVERSHILKVFEASGRNKSLAAKTLGVNRKTLYRKLVGYGVIVDRGIDEKG